ncbi:MAG: 16S rRNA (guanine(527)-N(7))-methyltransferase RsmG [Anaerolineae bacterium]|nr:16S rRNA (guanine(527)-N(7))-methyltransferase RsmG [Anaerolineae bacterium]
METLALQARELFGITLDVRQLNALRTFERELLAWNAHTNLTAIRAPAEVRLKHFLDAISCAPVMKDARCQRLVDVGTGAGFPGLVLKIIFPTIDLTLVDSIGKKTAFCQHIVEVLGLEGVTVITARAEELGQRSEHRHHYDWAVARAVARLPVLLEYCLPLVKTGGKMLAQKGESAPAEAQAADHAAAILGASLEKLIPVELPGVSDLRYLVIYRKHAPTPRAYPRRAGVPAKSPLTRT